MIPRPMTNAVTPPQNRALCDKVCLRGYWTPRRQTDHDIPGADYSWPRDTIAAAAESQDVLTASFFHSSTWRAAGSASALSQPAQERGPQVPAHGPVGIRHTAKSPCDPGGQVARTVHSVICRRRASLRPAQARKARPSYGSNNCATFRPSVAKNDAGITPLEGYFSRFTMNLPRFKRNRLFHFPATVGGRFIATPL